MPREYTLASCHIKLDITELGHVVNVVVEVLEVAYLFLLSLSFCLRVKVVHSWLNNLHSWNVLIFSERKLTPFVKMNYLRRRFSSSDIQKDLEDEDTQSQQSFGSAASGFFGFGAGKKGT